MSKTILVLEDERALSSAIESSLTKQGFKVVVAAKVSDAISLLDDLGKIDAVWLDHYLLGDENGLDFLSRLRNMDDNCKVPVFVVTNSVSDDKISKYELLGIEKYFVKSNSSLAGIIGSIKEAIV